ncbi:hypothetical protein [Halostella salina]|uniref:hypothetical protein n=1 Tax=Halostella salina TaxID=1547897 RepID=UPI000EF774B4|nr:hypothetical protein [Halostella salina]
MSGDKARVDFNAPEDLVEEADAVADLLDTSRTNLLIDALRQQLDEIANDESFRRRLKEAYYEDRLGFETVEMVLGREEATRLRLLRESLDREPPVPDTAEIDPPSESEFYDGEIAEWTPDEQSDDEESQFA